MWLQIQDKWYYKITKCRVPNCHSHYWCGASGQENSVTCAAYLVNSIRGHKDISLGPNHISLKHHTRKRHKKKFLYNGLKNYKCNKSTQCLYFPYCKLYLSIFSVYVCSYPTSSQNLSHMHFCLIVWFPSHILSVLLLQGTLMTLRKYKTRFWIYNTCQIMTYAIWACKTWNSRILKSVFRPVTQTLLLFNDGGYMYYI